MRFLIPALVIVVLLGCSSKKPMEDNVVTKSGLIMQKDIVDAAEVDQQQGRTRTSVFGSFSSGGGVSIGLGFLFSGMGSETPKNPVKYQVNLLDGTEVTLYHESRDFEIGDCVEISMHEDMEKHPPSMKRNQGGC